MTASYEYRILVVDDEPDILEAVRRALTPSKLRQNQSRRLELQRRLFNQVARPPTEVYDLTLLRQGGPAVKAVQRALAQSRPFAVAFVDVLMPPGPDGLETARRIREADPDVEIVMVTGHTAYSPEDLADAIRPRDKLLYVQKPFYGHEIRQFASSLCAKWTLAKELAASERRYRSMVNNQKEAVCRLSPHGDFLFANPSCASAFGLSEEELYGRRFLDFVPEEDHTVAQRSFTALAEGVTDSMGEFRLRSSAGRMLWMQWSFRGLPGPGGDLGEVQTVGRDITDRVQAVQAYLKANSEKERYRQNLEAVFRSLPDTVLTFDAGGRLLSSNYPVNACCPAAEASKPGAPLDAVFPDPESPCRKTLIKALESPALLPEKRFQVAGPAGDRRTIAITCSPLLDENETPSGVVMLVRDVSRQDELERRLEDRRRFGDIIARSEPMQKLFRTIEQLADVDSAVLIMGESGVGKELVADALHYTGKRSQKPMVKVNCSALTESLIESELFGHARGAFTGAVAHRMGRVEAAQSGTLFLDEIGELTPSVQVKLLRLLEQKEFQRVGENTNRTADVRFVAATNVDLTARVHAKEFREDLYYRLKVMVLTIPPLRERREDIPLLADHFVSRFRQSLQRPVTNVTEAAMDYLLRYPWPGNVRELKHSLEHACILTPEGEIDVEHLPPELVGYVDDKSGYLPAAGKSAELSRDDIQSALAASDGNKTRAAERLGVSRVTLYRHMAKLGLALD